MNKIYFTKQRTIAVSEVASCYSKMNGRRQKWREDGFKGANVTGREFLRYVARIRKDFLYADDSAYEREQVWGKHWKLKGIGRDMPF